MILAGGRGSRLRPLTDWRAKPAVPFGGKFRIIDFALSNCVNSGSPPHRHPHPVQGAEPDPPHAARLGLPRRPARRVRRLHAGAAARLDQWYRGTADAVFQNLDILRRHEPRYVLVLAGDHVYKMDYAQMLAEHVAPGRRLTVACVEVPLDEASAFGVMGVDESMRVTGFVEKPASPPPMPGRTGRRAREHGHLRLQRAVPVRSSWSRDADDSQSSHDFGKDIIPHLVARGYRVVAHRSHDSCVNMATAGPTGATSARWMPTGRRTWSS